MFLERMVESLNQLRPRELLLHLLSQEFAQFVGDLAMHLANPSQLEVIELQPGICNDRLQLQAWDECRRLDGLDTNLGIDPKPDRRVSFRIQRNDVYPMLIHDRARPTVYLG